MKKKLIALILSSLMVFQPVSTVSASDENSQFTSGDLFTLEDSESVPFTFDGGESVNDGGFTDIENIPDVESDKQGDSGEDEMETLTGKATASAIDNSGNYIPTDVSSPSKDCTFVGIKGNYIAQADQALARINEIRLEACKEGVPNPAGGGNLTMDDYVPIKWSSDLEYIARIRAAESSLTLAHARTNGKYIFQLRSPNFISSEAEVMAWNWTDNMIAGINQWYAEKKDYINHTGGVTGHYTSMIDPTYLYVGLATFCSDVAVSYNTTAGEFSTQSDLDETQAPGINDCIQILDMKNSYLTGYSITGTSSGKVSDNVQLQLGLNANIRNKYTVEGLTPVEPVIWSSSDDTVASVDETGLLTANRCGAANITVQDDSGLNASFAFTVEHSPEVDSEIPATCETAGKTEGSHCSVCGQVIKKQEEIPATGHKEVKDKAVAATCETAGKTEGSHCSVCGQVIKKQEEIPATGHKEVKDKAVAATCETAGKTEGSHCSVCGQVIKKQEEIPATGHKWNEGTITKEASCIEAGEKTYTCAVCGKTRIEEIPATGHKEVKDKAVAATCLTPGKTEGSHCSVCHAIVKAQKTVPAKGHSWSAWKTVTKATVFAPAKQTRTCSVCKKQETRTAGSKLTPTIKLNYTGLILQTRQSTSAVKVSGLANGDSVRSWKSSNTKIVKVDSRGKITAQKTTGKAYITVTLASKKTANIKVVVQKSAVKTTKLTGLQKKLTLKKDQGIILKPVRYPITSTEKITYASSNKKVVIVNSKGAVKAVGAGSAYITVKCGKAKFIIKVGVPKTKTTAINVAKSIKVKKGKSVVLKTKVTPANTDDKTVYASSNKKVATVTSKGVIKGVKKGKAVITVKSGSKSVKCTVTVV